MTHTFAILEISEAAFLEIEAKLLAAGYDHALDDERGVIDMHEIGLKKEGRTPRVTHPSA